MRPDDVLIRKTVILDPGSSEHAEPHHHDVTTTVTIHQGTAVTTFYPDETEHVTGPGESLEIPAGQVHNATNQGHETVIAVVLRHRQ